MALPVTISSVIIPDQNYYIGPFLSGGNFYTVLLDSTDESLVEVHKATDPTSSFSEQDSANKPNTTDDIRSMWVHQEGTDLHIVHGENDGTTTARYGYSVFHMATDLWDGTIVNEEIEASVTTVATSQVSCSISVRSDGDVVVLYNGAIDTVHGAPRQRVDYRRREGGTWSSAIAVDNAAEFNWFGSVIVRGSSDRMHFFFKNDTQDDAYQRTLTSGNSLEAFPSAGDTATDTDEHIFGPGVSYDDGGTQRVRCPYADASAQISYAEFDSADTPGAFTVNADVGDNTVQLLNRGPVACLSADGTDEHLLYADDTDQDLFHDKNDGTDDEILDGVTINRISCNVYDRSGTRLAYVYDDGGTIKYGEVSLVVAPARLPYLLRVMPPLGEDLSGLAHRIVQIQHQWFRRRFSEGIEAPAPVIGNLWRRPPRPRGEDMLLDAARRAVAIQMQWANRRYLGGLVKITEWFIAAGDTLEVFVGDKFVTVVRYKNDSNKFAEIRLVEGATNETHTLQPLVVGEDFVDIPLTNQYNRHAMRIETKILT